MKPVYHTFRYPNEDGKNWFSTEEAVEALFTTEDINANSPAILNYAAFTAITRNWTVRIFCIHLKFIYLFLPEHNTHNPYLTVISIILTC